MTKRGPLAGIRVTDFTWIGAGSFATKMLADAGAEVIKIESAERLDSLRVAPPFKDRIKGVNRSGYFSDRNTSKRSFALNLKDARAREIVLRLAKESDVVANNFTPGVMERLGLDYDSIRAIKPDIIYLSMSMQGSSGPHSRYLGYGLTIGALSGLHHLSGLPERLPAGTGTNYPDHLPNPCHGVFALLAALRHRRRTGEGQHIDIAQTEPTIALLAPSVLEYTVNGRVVNRTGNDHPSFAPHGVYPCAGTDRWLAIVVTTDRQWQALVEVLDAPAWTADERWNTASSRHANRRELDISLGEATRQWSGEELMNRLQVAGVAAGLVQDAADLIDRDPQLAHRGHWVRLDHAEMGVSLYNAPPYRFSSSRVELASAAPLLGEHTLEILEEVLAIGRVEGQRLIDEGVLV
ncbi:CaiB/BaiF CoA transferase family protein [Microvirga antarctica]|uniref:CaiB/BaiF CoA transferase family protein n=1 Tax=Microvirga antarctica TaxID=2819233 RepID=UPI001B305703|nr:CoA transferase [Microvirga antarctica]